FQIGLHQQSRWGPIDSPYRNHMNQRVFWTLYFTDRRVALSCGRPYGMKDDDIDVGEAAWLNDKVHISNLLNSLAHSQLKVVLPNEPLPQPDLIESNNMYLSG